MNFIQPNFFIFLFIFCFLYHFFGQKLRITVGLVGSFYFYSYFSPAYAFLLLSSSFIDFFIAAKIDDVNEKKVLSQSELNRERLRRHWLCISLFFNLGILFFFKYFSFFYNNIAEMLYWKKISSTTPPMGISFFTFQTLSYSLDVYRGKLKPIKRFRHFLFYVSFFPQLVAGPIVRAKDFLPQLSKAKLDIASIKSIFLRFGRGFIKKTCLADGLGVLIVDPVHQDMNNLEPIMAWIAVIAYGLQLYLDFSGYSDMAIALGRLLGFTFPENFKYPYLATNFSDFWKRWHISLSSWLRDYLYISLGGRHCSIARWHSNLLITMVLGGLWHGAGWNFLIWGALNGTYLVLEQISNFKPTESCSPIKKYLGRVWVVSAYFFSLIFFRAENCSQALHLIDTMTLVSVEEIKAWFLNMNRIEEWQIPLLMIFAVLGHVLHAFPRLMKFFHKIPVECQVICTTSIMFWMFHFYPSGSVSPFIYFQF